MFGREYQSDGWSVTKLRIVRPEPPRDCCPDGWAAQSTGRCQPTWRDRLAVWCVVLHDPLVL